MTLLATLIILHGKNVYVLCGRSAAVISKSISDTKCCKGKESSDSDAR